MVKLLLASLQAPNQEPIAEQLSGYLSKKLEIQVDFARDLSWQERERAFDAGQIDICWICGAPYVRKKENPVIDFDLLSASVMAGERYQEQPVYFSDVVVRADSPYQRFEDLKGTRWSYNDVNSHSGYAVTQYVLAKRGLDRSFFSEISHSGYHQRSLKWVLKGRVDASAIDTTVLEIELRNDPAIAEQIRVIDVFGPSPIPPWVISYNVHAALRKLIRDTFATMHTDPDGQAYLQAHHMKRFVRVTDEDYDPIREMLRLGQNVTL